MGAVTKTFLLKPQEVNPSWFVVDASEQVVGRLAVKLATILMGKHKPTYTPHVACGDFVVVVNADKVRFSGQRVAHPTHPDFTAKMARKTYEHYTGYPGGRKVETGAEVLEKDPTKFLYEAVRRMLPKNKLRSVMLSRLKLYAGPNHPHQAQQPQELAG
jgi:large subunit ribosomal protein L13